MQKNAIISYFVKQVAFFLLWRTSKRRRRLFHPMSRFSPTLEREYSIYCIGCCVLSGRERERAIHGHSIRFNWLRAPDRIALPPPCSSRPAAFRILYICGARDFVMDALLCRKKRLVARVLSLSGKSQSSSAVFVFPSSLSPILFGRVGCLSFYVLALLVFSLICFLAILFETIDGSRWFGLHGKMAAVGFELCWAQRAKRKKRTAAAAAL